MCAYVYLQFYLGIATVVQSVFTICACVVVTSFGIRDKFVIVLSVTTSLSFDATEPSRQHVYASYASTHIYILCTVKLFARAC